MTCTDHAAPQPPVRVFGVRHHGPGSSRALAAAFECYRPDCVLIEGPADADDLLVWAGNEQLQPPVALLAWQNDDPACSSFWPMAVFSPEWQAAKWAADHGVETHFMDLPAANVLAEHALKHVKETEAQETASESDEGCKPEEDSTPERLDPIAELARLAGYDDPEAWWEDAIELRLDGDPFDALTEAIGLLREDKPETDEQTLRREAYMRRALRAAKKRGHERIAVVCGAWHAPALSGKLPAVSADNAILSGLPKVKTSLTWVPWTHRRLASASGYGAGITSPGWYHHLFTVHDKPVIRWLALVAQALRSNDLPVSSAHIIEGTRLAEALAVMRGRPLPGLDELNEATWAVLCEGSDLKASLVTRDVVIGETLGKVPDRVPMVPLDADLKVTAKKLRLTIAASAKEIVLDLRKPADLAKSHLLRRARILGIEWGTERAANTTGTFKEAWSLEWRPEFAVDIIEAAAFGNTLASAAGNALIARAVTLPQVTSAVEQAFTAGLGDVLPELLRLLDEHAASEPDIMHLLESIPALARAQRYGDVRGTDASSLNGVLRAVLARACAGLPAAAAGVSDDVAENLRNAIDEVQAVIGLVEDESRQLWREALLSTLANRSLPGILAGRIVRLLLEAEVFTSAQAGERLSRALSQGTDPERQARWIEGFLAGNALLLIHDRHLLAIVHEWATRIPSRPFIDVLPALRRAFGSWSVAERRELAAQVARLGETAAAVSTDTEEENFDFVAPVLDTVGLILGGKR